MSTRRKLTCGDIGTLIVRLGQREQNQGYRLVKSLGTILCAQCIHRVTVVLSVCQTFMSNSQVVDNDTIRFAFEWLLVLLLAGRSGQRVCRYRCMQLVYLVMPQARFTLMLYVSWKEWLHSFNVYTFQGNLRVTHLQWGYKGAHWECIYNLFI